MCRHLFRWRAGILDLEKVSWTQLITRGIDSSLQAFEEGLAADSFPLLLRQFKTLCGDPTQLNIQAPQTKLASCTAIDRNIVACFRWLRLTDNDNVGDGIEIDTICDNLLYAVPPELLYSSVA